MQLLQTRAAPALRGVNLESAPVQNLEALVLLAPLQSALFAQRVHLDATVFQDRAKLSQFRKR